MSRNYSPFDVIVEINKLSSLKELGNDLTKLQVMPGLTAKFKPLRIKDLRGTHLRWITENGVSRPDPTSFSHEVAIDNFVVMRGVNAAGPYERCCTMIEKHHRVLFLEDGQVCMDSDYMNTFEHERFTSHHAKPISVLHTQEAKRQLGSL